MRNEKQKLVRLFSISKEMVPHEAMRLKPHAGMASLLKQANNPHYPFPLY
jgi:hypothetical protein